MTQAKGFKGFLVFQKETTFGVKPTTGRALKLPIFSQGLKAKPTEFQTNVLDGRRDEAETTRGNIDCSGDIVLGTYRRHFPFIAQMLHNSPTSDITFVVSATNNKMDLNENGGAELTATLDAGNYSIAQLEAELKKQLEVAGAGTYTAEYNRATRKFTISATGVTTFSFLFKTGTNRLVSPYDMLGFSTGADMTGALTITSTVALDEILITADNNKLDFSDDAGAEVTATITAGTYTLRTLLTKIKTEMEVAGAYTYTISYSDSTKKITIASDGTSLELKWATGTNTLITIGHILGFAVGADDTGTATYTADAVQNLYADYIFSTSESQPSYSIEYHQPDLGYYFLYTGIKAGNVAFSTGADAELNLTISTMGKTGVKYTSAQLSTYDEITNLAQWQTTGSSCTLDDVAYGSANNLEFALDYGMDGDTYTLGNGTRGSLTEGKYGFSGTLTALWEDDTIIAKGESGELTKLELTMEADKSLSYSDAEKFILEFPAIKFEQEFPALEGPAGIKTVSPFRASYDQTALTSIKMTIKNSRSHKIF